MKKPIRNIIILGILAFIGYRVYKKFYNSKDAETQEEIEKSKNFKKSMERIEAKPKVKLDLSGLEANQSPEQ